MAEDTEKAIMEAATRIFTERGYAGARMQDIADEAGINKALLHYYFRNKAGLFERIFEQAFFELMPRVREAVGREGTVLEKIERVVDLYIKTLTTKPHLPIFVMHELSQNQERFVQIIRQRLDAAPDFRGLAMQIMEEQAAGKLRDIPPLHLILNVMSLSVFPFMVKPVFCNLLEMPESDYLELMADRKDIVMEFVRRALVV